MTQPNLMIVCAAAFAAVLLVLGLLAGLIRLLALAFPHVEAEGDAAVFAAINTAAARAYPGMRVTNIQEHR